VRGYIKSIYEKLQVHSKSEAVVKAIKGKIV
jgi:DNA-binding CsgD family transcriptional regulator